MPRVVAAMFADAGRAEQALQALITAGIARDRISLVGEVRHPSSELAPGRTAPDPAGPALAGLSLPPEDARLFGEGLRRGCVVISARVDRPDLDRCIEILDMYEPVDLDRRSAEWTGDEGPGSGGAAPLGAGLTAGAIAGTTDASALPGKGTLFGSGSELGTGDLRTGGSGPDLGHSSTTPVEGDVRADRRAGAPGVGELAGRDTPPGRGSRVRSYGDDR